MLRVRALRLVTDDFFCVGQWFYGLAAASEALYLRAANENVNLRAYSNHIDTGVPIPTSAWTHICVRYDGVTTGDVFINNVLYSNEV